MRMLKDMSLPENSGHKPIEFLMAKQFIEVMYKSRSRLTVQEMRSLREMALKGDLDAAYEKLDAIINETNPRRRYVWVR